MAEFRQRALAEGFDAMGVVRPRDVRQAGDRLMEALARGWHGDMAWMAAKAGWRRDPSALWPGVRSVVMLGVNYNPPPGREPESDSACGLVSVYAQGKDYHGVIKGRLKALAGWMVRRTGCEVKVFVDTAPVMEKPLAQAAGLGWQGKHTNLVSRRFGSWLFLGAIFCNVELPPDAGEEDRCGACRRCLDVCPTKAFPAPYQLDARRCISYLTIEFAGCIPEAFRRAIGLRIYGCDDCLSVCPWNKFARAAREARFAPKPWTDRPPLGALLELDDAGFRAAFSGTPVKRIGWERFLRNVLIAAGNSGDLRLMPKIRTFLDHPSPLLSETAAWAAQAALAGVPSGASSSPSFPKGRETPAADVKWGEDA
jgi:epoxyqueuosine reductase